MVARLRYASCGSRSRTTSKARAGRVYFSLNTVGANLLSGIALSVVGQRTGKVAIHVLKLVGWTSDSVGGSLDSRFSVSNFSSDAANEVVHDHLQGGLNTSKVIAGKTREMTSKYIGSRCIVATGDAG